MTPRRPWVSRPRVSSSRTTGSRPALVLPLAVLATVVVLVLAMAGAPGLGPLRSAGGAVLGSLERLLSPARTGAVTDVTVERDRLLDQLREADRASADQGALAGLLRAPTTTGATLVPAHVVAVGRVGAAGPERVTIDVGTRDGVTTDLTVVATGGLVGRIVATTPWTSDVALLGSPDVVVGARSGTVGSLGTVSPSGPGTLGTRSPGELSLELVGPGALTTGDAVVTLGSVDGHPFVAGVPIGTVASVDPQRGRLTPTAAVRPAVDVTALDIVGVLLTAPRTTPRPSVTGVGP